MLRASNPTPGVGKRRRVIGWVAIAFCTFLSACFDPQDGCLDIAATNFNAAADKNCCCRYPQLQLNVDQVYDTLVFRTDSLYPDANGHLFRIHRVVFYLSEFQLFRGNEAFEMGDSLVLKASSSTGGDTISRDFTDDFVLIRRSPLKNEVASFREEGYFDRIKFRLGLSEDADRIYPALAPANHPLSPKTEQLHDGGYVWLQAVVTRDSMTGTTPDTLNFQAADLGDFFVEGSGNFYHPVGYDFEMTLKADWAKLFEGINWATHDKLAWKNQIVANMPSVFSVSQ